MGTGLWWVPAVPPGPASAAAPAGERLIIRTPRGFIFGEADGVGFLCNEAAGILDGEDASFATPRGGPMLMATYSRGVVKADADGCVWDPITAVSTTPAFDVVATPANVVYVVGGAPHEGQHFWSGGEAGASWTPLANTETPYTRVRLAPSNPSRVYLSGLDLGPTGKAIQRLGVSDDGGKTVVDRLIALGPDDLQARVLGVDPLHADHVYVYVEANSAELPERILLSQDAGQSFTTGPTLHDILGFAQSDDGRRVWIGGKEGVVRSSDGGVSFSAPLAKLTAVTCLAFHGGRLYACGVLDNQIVVAVSDDDGDTFSKVFSFDQVRRTLDCPGVDPARAPAQICADSLAHWRAELGTDGPSPDAGASGGAATGGAGGAPILPPPPAAASGCALSGDGVASAGAGSLIAMALAFLFRRPRNR
jgi:hypothetical protein